MVIVIPFLDCKYIDLELEILYGTMVGITINVFIPLIDFVAIFFEGTQPSCWTFYIRGSNVCKHMLIEMC